MTEQLTPAQARYHAALADAIEVGRTLPDDRAAGMAVAIDLGTSACFLFSLSEVDYERATELVRLAIAHAQRTED